MSEKDATLDDFVESEEGSGAVEEHRKQWVSVKIEDVAWKRTDNVDPNEVDLERHVGLEHIKPNKSKPDWESIDGLSSTKRRFNSGDILFAKLRPNLEKSAQPDFEGVASTDIFPIVTEEGINSKFLLYRLSSKPAFDHARRTSVGTRMPRTSWNLFSNFEFELPPVAEQRKIATVLHNVDQAIQKTEEIIEQTERTKRGVAQELFHHSIDNQETVETWLGKIPSTWEVVPFKHLVASNRNGLYKSTDAYGEGYPIAKMGNALEERVLDMSTADRLELTESEKEKYALQQGDLIFARRAQEVSAAGDCCYVPELDELTVFESSLIRVRLTDQADPRFYTQYFEGPIGSNTIERIITETSISGIATSDLLELKTAFPPLEEQREIASILWDFDKQVEALQTELDRYEQFRQGLMQDLLSGTVRITDTNIEVLPEVAQHG
jgi:type I restriction enzyme S subunit